MIQYLIRMNHVKEGEAPNLNVPVSTISYALTFSVKAVQWLSLSLTHLLFQILGIIFSSVTLNKSVMYMYVADRAL